MELTKNIPSPWKTHIELQVLEPIVDGGSFGQISKAVHNITREMFAVKKVSVTKSVRELTELENVFREVIVQKKILSENVVRYVNSWLEEDKNEILVDEITLDAPSSSFSSTTPAPEKYFLFIQMELCHGDLKNFLKNNKRKDLKTNLDMIYQLSKGLAAVHKFCIIHRDLKPANIFYTVMKNGKLVWKIGDFGLSVTLKNESDKRTPRGTGIYRSSEMAKGSKRYTTRTDIFSLALVFLEIFLKQNQQSNKVNFFLRLQQRQVKKQQLLDLKIPKFLHSLLLRMLLHDPKNRPSARKCSILLLSYNLQFVRFSKGNKLPGDGVNNTNAHFIGLNLGCKQLQLGAPKPYPSQKRIFPLVAKINGMKGKRYPSRIVYSAIETGKQESLDPQGKVIKRKRKQMSRNRRSIAKPKKFPESKTL